MVQDTQTTSKTRGNGKGYIFAVGRRREAIARVRLYKPSNGKVTLIDSDYKKGDVIVNGKPFGEYFRFSTYIPKFKKFFDITGARDTYMVSVKVAGGGLSGQLDAVIHGIARTLDKADGNKFHKLLHDSGYLTRDARTRERRKVGTGGKARRKKQSPKR